MHVWIQLEGKGKTDQGGRQPFFLEWSAHTDANFVKEGEEVVEKREG